MSNRVNITDFVHDEPFRDNSQGCCFCGNYKSFCPKCRWNSSWSNNHNNCDGKIVLVPSSIRFPKKTASKRTWKVFTKFLIREKKLTEEEQLNKDRLTTLNQILSGGTKRNTLK